ncbi:MAG: hypothetical protein U0271_04415 [Polyangiaceae bacterium]
MSATAAIRAGARMAAAKILNRRAAGVVAVALATTLALAIVERRMSPSHASDRALASTFRLVVPVVTFGLSQLAIGTTNLRDATWPAARFGMPRAFVAVGLVAGGAIAAALASLVCALVAVVATRAGVSVHDATTASFGADALTSSWIGGLVGAAYAALFGLGATIGKRGGVRVWLLTADFLVGNVGALGVVFPRGGAYNLIGLEAPLDLSQRAASALLVGSMLVYGALVAAQCARAPR